MTHADTALVPEAVTPTAADAADVHIGFEKFQLRNGLTVIVHENRRAPAVCLNLWYRVGSKEEPVGKTGFAHLFEHLMFDGSANFPGRFIANLKSAGATALNGTTNRDRTNYYETVPTVALDYALFAESDRMGHFYETISQEALDLQRGVVQNEKRDTEGKPYGGATERIVLGTYPVGHPYAHTVLGSMADLDGATLDDVRNWFGTYYGPSNAVLTLAGDIDVSTAREKVARYFGHISPGKPLARPRQWIAKMSGTRREVLEDYVPQARLHMFWNVPQYGHPDLTELSLAAAVLTSGMSARLRKRLMYRDRVVTSVSAEASGRTIAGQFAISASIAAGGDVDAVEQAIEEEVARLVAEGPEAVELSRARSRSTAAFLRQLDDLSVIADMLSMNEARLGQPDFYRVNLARLRAATPNTVRAAAERWLRDGLYSLQVVPFKAHRPQEPGIDRSRPPEIGRAPGIHLPEIQRETLSNGLRVVLAERHDLPLVRFNLHVDAGSICESPGRSGIAQLTTSLMSAGAGFRNALQFAEAKQDIGAELGAATAFEYSHATLFAMKDRLQESLQLYADMILRPRFDPEDFERERASQIMDIRHQRSSGTLKRALSALLLPDGHPYARPLSGSGLESHVRKALREHVVEFHSTWYRPHLATLVIVGDTTMAQIKPLLEDYFGGWERSSVACREVPLAPRPESSAVHVSHKSGAQQSYLYAASLLDPIPAEQELAADAANSLLAGDFGSRLNMNLRESKHWTYGVRSTWLRLRGPQFYTVKTSVQNDKTCEALAEIRREIADFIGARPVTAAELAAWQRLSLLRLATSTASLGGLGHTVETLVRRRLPDDYWLTYADRVNTVTTQAVTEVARKLIDPKHVIWMIDGDATRFEGGLRDLGLGPVTRLPSKVDELYSPAL